MALPRGAMGLSKVYDCGISCKVVVDSYLQVHVVFSKSLKNF